MISILRLNSSGLTSCGGGGCGGWFSAAGGFFFLKGMTGSCLISTVDPVNLHLEINNHFPLGRRALHLFSLLPVLESNSFNAFITTQMSLFPCRPHSREDTINFGQRWERKHNSTREILYLLWGVNYFPPSPEKCEVWWEPATSATFVGANGECPLHTQQCRPCQWLDEEELVKVKCVFKKKCFGVGGPLTIGLCF